jgi:hypothetical protein
MHSGQIATPMQFLPVQFPATVTAHQASKIQFLRARPCHIPAVFRCLDIIEYAMGASSLPLGDIADRPALPSGAHRLLATLVRSGWAEKRS